MLAGWSSNNKFSLMGAIRSSAQIISYELAMTTAAAGVVLVASSFKLNDIIAAQQRPMPILAFVPQWNIFIQPLGFIIFLVSAFAETNRLPFDLPEAEAELVAGYHTEYSAMRFGAFYMAEYVNVVVACAITVTLYLGGWSLPGFHPESILGVALLDPRLRGEDRVPRVGLHVGPLDAPAVPLRPAHAPRLEGPAAAGAREPVLGRGARDGPGGEVIG